SQFLFGGMGRLNESSVLSIKNRSHSVTAKVVVPDDSPAHGVIVAQGGRFGGWSIYAYEGRLKYCYNYFGLERFLIDSTSAVGAGEHEVRAEFNYDGHGIGKGGTVSLLVDADKVGEGRVERTVPVAFSIDETCDVGVDDGLPVCP